MNRPVFSEDEVAEHATKDTGVWVTYQGGVYDVTNWVGMSIKFHNMPKHMSWTPYQLPDIH